MFPRKGLSSSLSGTSRDTQPVILVIFNASNRGPVGLYELLVEQGHPCKLVYYLDDDHKNRDAVLDFIRRVNPILVGFSFASQSTKIAFPLADYLRSILKIPLIFGGVHPTVDPLSCLDHCHAVCVGEGEMALLEIVGKIKNSQDYLTSNNLIFKQHGTIIQNPLNPLIADLDVLPFRRPYTKDHVMVEDGKIEPVTPKKYFELFPSNRIRHSEIFSRGCPHACTYCCNSKFREIYPNWSKVRSMSVEKQIDEIDRVIQLHPKIIRIFIIDDCFLVHNAAWLQDFVNQWRQRINKEFNFFTIPEYLTREKLEILQTIDLVYCSIGLQTGSKRTNLSLYERKFSKESFLHACHLIRSMGIGLLVNILFDNPWEDSDDVLETLDILTQIEKPFYISQYSLKIYPGTKLFDYCKTNNIAIPDFNQWFDNYNVIRRTDANSIIILTQFLPSNVIFLLFKHRHNMITKIVIRILYLLACSLMPFHALRVCGTKGLRRNIVMSVRYSRGAVKWVKGLLGIRK